MSRIIRISRTAIAASARLLWRTLPLGRRTKHELAGALFAKMSFPFRWTATYKNWQKEKKLELLRQQLISKFRIDGFAPLRATSAPHRTDARAIAFYLPQFHSIPENDNWWGEGFTEWTNVRRATPQFEGHDQPREPGELGYYDLTTDSKTRRRQVELAASHGLSGFCFYFYWFAGKRLLEQPIADYSNDPEINFPFCLCWANENWSRRWDGLNDHLLISQDHSLKDDIDFISYISRYLKLDNYIRIDGKPLVIVYRPALLPDARATAERWRDWCRDNDVGEIYLAYTQSFETIDPAEIGFDAAIEFPPNNAGLVAQPMPAGACGSGFDGKIYDWKTLPAKSFSYDAPPYTLFRGVSPSWDNTPRRMKQATILNNAKPDLYYAWLLNAIADTKERFSKADEQLIFINAWNEWAEGAYLEPDKTYGYAWLQATRDALAPNERKIIIVVHDLHKHGAQYLSLNMARTLKQRFGYEVAIIAGEDGALHGEFSSLGPIYVVDEHSANNVVAALSEDGFAKAIANSAASGWISRHFAKADIRFVGLVHELPSIIDAMHLESSLEVFDQYAETIIFPSLIVSQRDSEATGIEWRRPTILPQGLYKRDSFATLAERETARRSVVQRLNLPDNARITLGAGYADHRKGVDTFIQWGVALAALRPDVHSVWIGKIDPLMQPACAELLEATGDLAGNIHFPGFVEDTEEFYAAADLYALTSREDPFPSTALEALAGGAPVIMAAGTGGIEDLARHECVTALTDAKPKSYVKAAAPLIGAQSAKRDKSSLLGRSLVRMEFGFVNYMGNLLRLLGEPCPKVSVIVPNYNYGRHLEQRLRSILDQSLPPYEIIFLDDASSDDSVKIAEDALAKSDIRYQIIRNETNSGSVFAQWRKGVELARGDFIWIAEADDWADPEFLDATVSPLAADPRLVLSYTQSSQATDEGEITCPDYLDYVADVDPERWRRGYRRAGSDEIRESMSVKNTIPNVSGVIFKATALRQLLAHHHAEISEFRVAGDWYVYVNMLRQGDVVFDPRPLNFHRRHAESVTISRFGLDELGEIARMQAYVAREFGTPTPYAAKANDYLAHLVASFNLNERHNDDEIASVLNQ